MYDAIIIGARVAGSATAMLLARKGHRVLLLDKASFPSDTISTHYVHVKGAAKLKSWGLLDTLAATGCPPIPKVLIDFGAIVLSGSAPPAGDLGDAYAPRRTVLDKMLLDAAAAAGAEVRERYPVEELLFDGDRVTGVRGSSREQARIVIGADGMRSLVARSVDTASYQVKPILSCLYYTYWSGVPLDRAELYIRERRTAIGFPTHDNMICLPICFAIADFPEIRKDVEGSYLRALETTPLAERVRAGKREERFLGSADLPNYFRRPWGEGWALVGDAGYHKDPLTAQGITDAFLQADWLAGALDEGLTGRAPMDQALAGYEQQRNQHSMPYYEFACQRSAQGPPPPETVQLIGALQGNQRQIDRFIGLDAGTVRVEDFFSPANLAEIMAAS